MSLEIKISELSAEISELKIAIISLKEVLFSTNNQTVAPELPVKSFIEELKVKKAPKAKKVEPQPEPQPEPQQSSTTKANVLEAAKEKLTESAATKDDIKNIITEQGFNSLNDITNPLDFDAIILKIKAL